MREEFVELEKKFKKLQYKNFVKFTKETEIKNSFDEVRKLPALAAFVLFIVLDVIFWNFLPWILSLLFAIFIVYLLALICSCLVEIKVQNNKLYIKKFLFKKIINECDIKKIYLVTSKIQALGGLRAKIKIIYKNKRGEDIYSVDTMFLKYDKVKKMLSTVEVEPLTDEEKKNDFKNSTSFVDRSLIEFVDICFLLPMCILIMIDFLL